MIAAMIQKVHIDYEWVAKEYLCRSREKVWDDETTKNIKMFQSREDYRSRTSWNGHAS